MKEKAEILINRECKVWLADKLGISRPTLDKRLIYDKWKKGEKEILIKLTKFS